MGREALVELDARADQSGVFLDFDGTLSEIAPMPDAAAVVPGTEGVLRRLAARFKVVAIVSGRRVSELAQRLGDHRGVRLFGLYGLEVDEAVPWGGYGSRAVEGILPRILELAAGIDGALVEPKGVNLAVHYRLAREPEAARTELLATLRPLAAATDLKLIEGKRVIELVSSEAPTKGDLLAREGAGLEGILYAGDDLADLEAFAAVDLLASGGAHGVKVAVRSPETPPELLDAANLIVEGPPGLVGLLESLVG